MNKEAWGVEAFELAPVSGVRAENHAHLMACTRDSRWGQSLSVIRISALVQLWPALCTRPATISSA